MPFKNVAESEWQLNDRIGSERKARLLSTPFEAIVQRIINEAKITSRRRGHGGCEKLVPGASRTEIELSVRCETVDLFHNGAGGYRAQFYRDIRQGEEANRYVINALGEKVRQSWMDQADPGFRWEFVDASLRDPDAKIWIFEGDWFDKKSDTDRNLTVDRWAENLDRIMPLVLKLRFEPGHPTLTPDNEARLELKGGCVDADHNSIEKRLKPCRSQEIHDYGYT